MATELARERSLRGVADASLRCAARFSLSHSTRHAELKSPRRESSTADQRTDAETAEVHSQIAQLLQAQPSERDAQRQADSEMEVATNAAATAAGPGPGAFEPSASSSSVADFNNWHYIQHNQRRQEHLSSLNLDLAAKRVLEVGTLSR